MIMKLEEKVRAMLGDFDPSTPPPAIAPVSEGVHRPRWSVMIPTYNCAKFLRQTLESVLSQAPGPDEMQIEVIDDCSPQDDPEAVVREIGKGRVAFYRKPKNEGAIPNFNTCIERSRGELVHILHGDDWVLPGFYRDVERMAMEHEECALLATRCFFVDEAGILTGITGRLYELEKGGRTGESFLAGPAIQFAGVVLRRIFFEQHGGFRCSLVHCADWEMWVRAITQGGGVVSPEVLACYRMFEGNDTNRLVQSGENLRDILRHHLTVAYQHRDYPLQEAIGQLVGRANMQAETLHAAGKTSGAGAAAMIATALSSEFPRPPRDLAWFLYGVANVLRRKADALRKV